MARSYLSVVHLFVLHKLSMRKRLLAHITESNIPATVNLMCCKIGFWNVMLAKDREHIMVR